LGSNNSVIYTEIKKGTDGFCISDSATNFNFDVVGGSLPDSANRLTITGNSTESPIQINYVNPPGSGLHIGGGYVSGFYFVSSFAVGIPLLKTHAGAVHQVDGRKNLK